MNEKYFICYCNKKYNFDVANLELSEKSNGDSHTFSFFLSLPCCCQCWFKRYIAKQTNSRTEETVRDVTLLSRQHVCLLFLSLSMWQATNHIILSFFLSFFLILIFSFFKDYNKKRQRSHLQFFFLSFFLSFFKYLCVQIHRCIYFCFQSRGTNIVNWMTMTRKSAKRLRTTYRNTGQLFREDVALGGGLRVLWKEYGCNLQDRFKLFGRVITMTSWFGITCVRYDLVTQL